MNRPGTWRGIQGRGYREGERMDTSDGVIEQYYCKGEDIAAYPKGGVPPLLKFVVR